MAREWLVPHHKSLVEHRVDSGAEVKAFLSTMPVWVNGEREARRGRKLQVDDIVQVDDLELRLTSENGGIQDHGRHHATAVRAER